MVLRFILPILLLRCITTGEAQNNSRFDNSTPPLVRTDSGWVQGIRRETTLQKVKYNCFLGIPYAEPPLGLLRFRPPVPKEGWGDAIFKATKDAPLCIQQDRDLNIVIGKEDCLYLNVFAPPRSRRLRPVMVWIHGGAFTTGNAASTFYGPDFLIEQNVVVVSVQYRLGPFGFLNINHENATGNSGLKDQTLALEWVQRNIANFGGDPERVTLLGQSAGGVAVDLHKISDMSTGLFQQTISMSASPLCIYWAFQSNVEAEYQAFLLGEQLDVRTRDKDKLLAELISAPAGLIIEKAMNLPVIPFRPTLENADLATNEPKFLTECTPDRYREGRYNKGPHMMGFTKDEILFLANTPDDLVEFTVMAPKFIKEHTPLNYLPFTSRLLSVPAYGFSNLTRVALEQIIDELSNLYFVTGIDKKQQLLSANNEYPIYYYHFVFDSPYSQHRSEGIQYLDGVAHEDELAHLFYRPHIKIPLENRDIATLRSRLVRLWTNFAKYGNPTPNGTEDSLLKVNWPDSTGDGLHLEIGNELKVKPRPTNLQIRFYQSIGLGDSSVFNDCNNNIWSRAINGIANIPGYFKNAMSKK